jgi:hypothetical protein
MFEIVQMHCCPEFREYLITVFVGMSEPDGVFEWAGEDLPQELYFEVFRYLGYKEIIKYV